MNKKSIILVSTVLVLVFGALFVYMSMRKTPVPVNTNSPTNSFPVSSSTNPINQDPVNTDDGTLSIMTSTGEIKTRNFVREPETVKDPVNKDTYYLGNHYPFDGSQSQQSPEYIIMYIPSTQYFNVSLLSEPIATSRIHAEEYLLEHLGVSKQELCRLNYMVSVPYFVNEFYTSQDLRFSFCPGSVSL